jgi:hypothetical protein
VGGKLWSLLMDTLDELLSGELICNGFVNQLQKPAKLFFGLCWTLDELSDTVYYVILSCQSIEIAFTTRTGILESHRFEADPCRSSSEKWSISNLKKIASLANQGENSHRQERVDLVECLPQGLELDLLFDHIQRAELGNFPEHDTKSCSRILVWI